MDIISFVGCVVLAFSAGLVIGHWRGHREADRGWQKILEIKEQALFRANLAASRPWANTVTKENKP